VEAGDRRDGEAAGEAPVRIVAAADLEVDVRFRRAGEGDAGDLEPGGRQVAVDVEERGRAAAGSGVDGEKQLGHVAELDLQLAVAGEARLRAPAGVELVGAVEI